MAKRNKDLSLSCLLTYNDDKPSKAKVYEKSSKNPESRGNSKNYRIKSKNFSKKIIILNINKPCV